MIAWTTVLIVAAVCVVLEGFFSGSEIAIVSADRTRLRQRAKAGHRGAAQVEEMMREPQVLLATTLMGTNLATVTFSVTVSLAFMGRANGTLLAIAAVTPATLLLGEIIPKTLFQRHADAIAPRIIYPLVAASYALRPGVWLMSGFAAVITKLLGIESRRAFVTRDELALLLEAEPRGVSDFTPDEREMISNVLDLSESTVGAVMVPLSEVTALPVDATLEAVQHEIADKQHSRIPVFEGRVDNIIGVLHVFDLLGRRDRSLRVGSLAKQAPFTPESQLAADLLVELQGSGNHMAVVVDEYGGAVGIVTVEDILEEIVGEIDDEHDEASPQIHQDRPGVWTVEGRAAVDRINRDLGLDLPEDDDYESVAGLVLEKMKRIPEEGESITLGSVTVRIIKSSSRVVTRVQITRTRRK